MAIAPIEKQQVTSALKSTGSSDADILFARKEEVLSQTRKLGFLGVLPIVAGAALCLTFLGAAVGVPAIWFGLRTRRRIRTNIETAEAAYLEYLSGLASRRPAAVI